MKMVCASIRLWHRLTRLMITSTRFPPRREETTDVPGSKTKFDFDQQEGKSIREEVETGR